jgi:hypothetical protein
MRDKIRKAGGSLALILVIAFGLRAGFAWHEERKIPADLVGSVPFLNETGNVARSLALGNGFGSVFRNDTGPTAWLTPVYPLLVAGIFRVFGIFTPGSFFAVVLLNILFSTAACVPIFLAGKRIGGLGVASGAAWLWAVFPNAIVIPYEWVWDTSLSALLGATILWATLELGESRGLRDWCAYGLLWGLALMTNPSLGSLLPFLLGWAVYRARQAGFLRWEKPLLCGAVVIICCVPWTVRNYTVFHRFIPLRSNLPFELWIGNNEVFDENSRDVTARVTSYEQVSMYSKLGETAFLDDKWHKAIQFMRDHRRLELELTRRRIVAFWMGSETPVRSFLETDSNFIRAILLLNLLATVGTLAGMVVLWRRRGAFAFPVAVIPVVFPLLYYVTHASLRYRHPIDPVMLLLTAVAIGAAFRTRWPRSS